MQLDVERKTASKIYASVNELRPYAVWPGSIARVRHGKNVMLAFPEMSPNIDIPEHQHENEQLGFVLVGSVTYVIGGEKRLLRPGDTYVIPSNVPHSASTGSDGATVVDIFTPPRADWEKLDRIEPRKPVWPGG